MKALLCKQFGLPDRLGVEEVASTPPLAGEVHIRVRACGVNFADGLIVQGLYQVKPPFPFSPGAEIAGDVLAVGEGVSHIKVGQRVIGLLNWGGMAEEVNAPAQLTFPIADDMPYAEAAALSIAYGTAHVALAHRGHLQSGQTLLVLGAAGGTGLAAVEIGKLMGATVIACASTPEKLALTRQYGADYTINYNTEDLRDRIKAITNGRGVNVVYDPVGGLLTESCLRSLAWEGRLLIIGFTSGTIPQIPANLPLVKNCSVIGVFFGGYALNQPDVLVDSLHTLLDWYSAGRLKPPVTQTFPLAQAGEAIASLLNRQATGKIVIEI